MQPFTSDLKTTWFSSINCFVKNNLMLYLCLPGKEIPKPKIDVNGTAIYLVMNRSRAFKSCRIYYFSTGIYLSTMKTQQKNVQKNVKSVQSYQYVLLEWRWCHVKFYTDFTNWSGASFVDIEKVNTSWFVTQWNYWN